MMKTSVMSRVKKFKKDLVRDFRRMFRPSKKNFLLPFSDDDNIRHYWAMFMIFS